MGGAIRPTVRDGGWGARSFSECPEILPETGNDQDGRG